MSETRIAELEQRVHTLEVEMERVLKAVCPREPVRKTVIGKREPLDVFDYSKGVQDPPEIV